jgi:hypothetical protein
MTMVWHALSSPREGFGYVKHAGLLWRRRFELTTPANPRCFTRNLDSVGVVLVAWAGPWRLVARNVDEPLPL